MKTHTPKKTEIQREWYLVDVEGKTLGRVATKIADILRGKKKPIFVPHLDCGDFVVVINAGKIKLTGNKLIQKEYHTHSRYPGGLKTIRAEEMLEKKPTEILKLAVAGMIPRNKLRKDALSKMKIFAEGEHKHEAQNPKPLEL